MTRKNHVRTTNDVDQNNMNYNIDQMEPHTHGEQQSWVWAHPVPYAGTSSNATDAKLGVQPASPWAAPTAQGSCGFTTHRRAGRPRGSQLTVDLMTNNAN